MRSLCLAVFATLAVARGAAAQDEKADIDRVGLPRDVAREATRLFNETAALRATDRVEIDEGRSIDGDVAVLNGPIVIGGRVRGRVLAVNSDVILRSTARIDGDLLVVGGEVEGRHAAYVGGEIRIYRQPLRFSQDGDRIVEERSDAGAETGWWQRWEQPRDRSGSRLQIASAGAYNRVEGLPINIGPQVFWNRGWGSARLAGYAVLRTETSFSGNRDDIGHSANVELRFGRRGGPLIGGRAFNVIEPTDSWQLSTLEAALAAFLARRDYRDYYERHGGSIRAGLFLSSAADVSVSYGQEQWTSRPTETPYTLFRRGSTWRPNPGFDEGNLHLINTALRIDTRNDVKDPWSGWYVVADIERGVGDIYQYAPRSNPVMAPAPGRIGYTRAFMDLRRYNRVSPEAQLNFRVVAGGWMNGDPLPLQRRFAVDGPGAMPGYDFRSSTAVNTLTCTTGTAAPGQPGQCDRMALAQIEYRGDIHFDFFSDWTSDHYTRGRSAGVWVIFADAGRGWLVGPSTSADPLSFGRNELPPLPSFRTDLGVGLDFDVIGVYVAKAMGEAQPANFFARIRHRF